MKDYCPNLLFLILDFSFELTIQVAGRIKKKTKTLRDKACEEKLKDYSGQYQKQARTMERKLTRLGFWITFLQKRIQKKDEFSTSYEILLAALGGNTTTPACNGDKSTKYAGNQSIFVAYFHIWNILIAETFKTLGDCKDEIFASCTVPDLPGNHTFDSLDACKNSSENFRSEFRDCAKILDNTERCDCITSMTEIDNSKCNITKINEVYKSIQNAREECISGKTDILQQ